jgi:hypothetical protein
LAFWNPLEAGTVFANISRVKLLQLFPESVNRDRLLAIAREEYSYSSIKHSPHWSSRYLRAVCVAVDIEAGWFQTSPSGQLRQYWSDPLFHSPCSSSDRDVFYTRLDRARCISSSRSVFLTYLCLVRLDLMALFVLLLRDIATCLRLHTIAVTCMAVCCTSAVLQ